MRSRTELLGGEFANVVFGGGRGFPLRVRVRKKVGGEFKRRCHCEFVVGEGDHLRDA